MALALPNVAVYGAFVAQSAERIHGKDEASGSIPLKGSRTFGWLCVIMTALLFFGHMGCAHNSNREGIQWQPAFVYP